MNAAWEVGRGPPLKEIQVPPPSKRDYNVSKTSGIGSGGEFDAWSRIRRRCAPFPYPCFCGSWDGAVPFGILFKKTFG